MKKTITTMLMAVALGIVTFANASAVTVLRTFTYSAADTTGRCITSTYAKKSSPFNLPMGKHWTMVVVCDSSTAGSYAAAESLSVALQTTAPGEDAKTGNSYWKTIAVFRAPLLGAGAYFTDNAKQKFPIIACFSPTATIADTGGTGAALSPLSVMLGVDTVGVATSAAVTRLPLFQAYSAGLGRFVVYGATGDLAISRALTVRCYLTSED